VAAEERTERVQFRLVGDRHGHAEVKLSSSESRTWIEDEALVYASAGTYANVRIQTRTVTESLWTDLPEKEGGADG
jgi:hypothetical protein